MKARANRRLKLALAVLYGSGTFMFQEAVVLNRTRRYFAVALLLVAVAMPGLQASAQDGGRKVKSKTEAIYPELAKRMHINGTVKVEVTITPAGVVKGARVVGGNPVLVESAVDAVKRWKFESATEETSQIVEFRFNGNAQ